MTVTAQQWTVHIKDIATGEHILEPVVASTVEVSYDFSGPPIGHLTMQFDSSVTEHFEWFWDNHENYPQVNIQVNPVHNDINWNGYSRCVLESMNFEESLDDSDLKINMTWTFMGNPYSESALAKLNPKSDEKTDWLQDGF